MFVCLFVWVGVLHALVGWGSGRVRWWAGTQVSESFKKVCGRWVWVGGGWAVGVGVGGCGWAGRRAGRSSGGR